MSRTTIGSKQLLVEYFFKKVFFLVTYVSQLLSQLINENLTSVD